MFQKLRVFPFGILLVLPVALLAEEPSAPVAPPTPKEVQEAVQNGSDTSAKSSDVVRTKIAQMEARQRALESQYRFAEAAALHAESINVAKAGGLPKPFIRREVAVHSINN